MVTGKTCPDVFMPKILARGNFIIYALQKKKSKEIINKEFISSLTIMLVTGT